MTASPAMPYVRDHFTWLAYLMIAFGTYGITALSPFMPFLAAELGMNYAVRGLHTSAFAIAGIILGLLADRIAHRVPRSTLVWLGSGGLAAASLLIVGGQSPALTIGGAFLGCLLMGVISNAMNILGVDTNVQTIITGAIIVGAVVLSNINNIRKK